MARTRSTTGSDRGSAAERKRLRSFLWLVASLAIALLALVQMISQQHIPPGKPLFSTTADAVLTSVLTAVLGTVLGSTLVGIILDEYQRRFSDRADSHEEFLRSEGIISIYESSQEPRLITAIERAIEDCRSHILGIGLGMSILMNRLLLMRIAQRITTERRLHVEVLLGSSDNQGVMNRVHEEENWHTSNNIAYDPTWVEYFPHEIRTILELHAGPHNHDRVRVVRLRSCPTIGLLKADQRCFVFLYGAPNMRGGSQSVWLEIDAGATDGFLNRFLRDYVAFFQAEAEEIRRSEAGEPN